VRLSILYIERCQLDVLDGAFVVVDKIGVRTHVPVGGAACLMLEPGTRVSHAVSLARGDEPLRKTSHYSLRFSPEFTRTV